MTNVADRFKQRAVELGMTHAQLAQQTGISRQSVYRKLNALTPMTVGEAWALAAALKLNLARLLRDEPGDG